MVLFVCTGFCIITKAQHKQQISLKREIGKMEVSVFSKEEKIGTQRVQVNMITILEKWSGERNNHFVHTLKEFKEEEQKTVN